MFSMLRNLFAPAAPRRRRRVINPVAAAVERLEDRQMLSGVTASLSAGVLTINGTEQNDTIRVHQTPRGISVQGTTISLPTSSVSSVPTTNVTKIVVNARGGNDLIDLNSNSSSTSQLLRAPSFIYAGSGNDTIYGTAAADTISSGTGFDRIWGYGGTDTIFARVGRDRVQGGTGNDIIRAELALDSLELAKSGRLFWNDTFASGNGTDTVIVRMDLKSFGSRLLKPALGEVRKAVSTFNPVLDLLDTEVPVLSGYGNLTYGKVLSQYKPELGRFLDSVRAVRNLSNTVNLSGWITLGEFKVTSGTAAIRTVSANPYDRIHSAALTAARRAGVQFGLLNDPQSAIRMMMGRNVSLMSLRLNLPTIEAVATKSYSVPTGVFAVNAEVDFRVKAWASAGAKFGLDMNGIWKGRVLDGLYISDAKAVVGVRATVKGGVALGVPNFLSIASIKGVGEVDGSIRFSLRGGSKVYLANLPDYYSQSLRSQGEVGYNIGIETRYSQLKTSYWYGVPYPEWVGATHYRRLGSGTWRL